MAVYAITGKLGAGKGKAGISKLRQYLRADKPIATNCDVFLEHLAGSDCRSTVTRVPDKPTATDLYMIGSGNKYVQFTPNVQVQKDGTLKGFAPVESPTMLDGFDESHNGILLLDECASWLNTRNFQDKGRAEILEWFIHARKYGWDVFFVMQNISQVDKQLRDSLFEYVVRVSRLDRMRVPLLSAAIQVGSAGALSGAMPRVHIAVVRMGSSLEGLVADRWYFQGDDLHKAYNTTQVFSETYPHGTHCLLSPWHLSAKAEYPLGPCRGPQDKVLLKERPILKEPKNMGKAITVSLLLGALLGGVGAKFVLPMVFPDSAPVVASAARDPAVKANAGPLVAKGFYRVGGSVYVMLEGRPHQLATQFKQDAQSWSATLPGGETVGGAL
jgi:hypothetical protein